MKTPNFFILFLIIFVIFGISLVFVLNFQESQQDVKTQTKVEPNVKKDIKYLDDNTPYIIHPDDLIAGGPPKDGIPPIDNPKFETINQADSWVQNDRFVSIVTLNNITKIYPQQVMVWHEIVNDEFANDKITISYCPLCGSSIAYNRTINNQILDFGTSGKLYNSNLVMYDRQTDSYWQQVGGKAIIGKLTGTKLQILPINVLNWSKAKEIYENQENVFVLSKETGYFRDYRRDPYGNYYNIENDNLYFQVEQIDNRLTLKTQIIGINYKNSTKAYVLEKLIQNNGFEDKELNLTIEVKNQALIEIYDKNNNQIPFENDFWFVWFAFHKDTLLEDFKD